MGCANKSQRTENQAAIITADERLVTRVHPALAVQFGTRRLRSPASPLDFLACSWPHLLLRIFLTRLSNPRIDWAARNSPCRRIPAGAGRTTRACGLLVCADGAVAIERLAHGHRHLLGRHDHLIAAGLELLAARHACGLFRVLSLVRERGAGFFRLSVGWHAAGGGIHCNVFRAGRISAGRGGGKPAVACESI